MNVVFKFRGRKIMREDAGNEPKVSFRVWWQFDLGSEEAEVYEYLNSLGRDRKRTKVSDLLCSAFYLEAVSKNGFDKGKHLDSCLSSILRLEQQLAYLRNFLATKGVDCLPSSSLLSVEDATSSKAMDAIGIPTADAMELQPKQVTDEDDWNEDEEEEQLYNPYDDDL